MNALDELQKIADEQKTVTTKKLAPLILEAKKMYDGAGDKIRRQANALDEMNKKYQQALKKIEKKKVLTENYQSLQQHHHNLTREYNKLLTKYEELKRNVK